MRTTLARAIVMAVLLTGTTAAIGMAQEPMALTATSCHSVAPNESAFGSSALSYRMCAQQRHITAEAPGATMSRATVSHGTAATNVAGNSAGTVQKDANQS